MQAGKRIELDKERRAVLPQPDVDAPEIRTVHDFENPTRHCDHHVAFIIVKAGRTLHPDATRARSALFHVVVVDVVTAADLGEVEGVFDDLEDFVPDRPRGAAR